jgi:hypothetical protein
VDRRVEQRRPRADPVALRRRFRDALAADRRTRLLAGPACSAAKPRSYWGGGLAATKPPLKFELLDAHAGVNTVAIHYRSVGHKYVVEVIEFNEQRVAIRGSACRGADA